VFPLCIPSLPPPPCPHLSLVNQCRELRYSFSLRERADSLPLPLSLALSLSLSLSPSPSLLSLSFVSRSRSQDSLHVPEKREIPMPGVISESSSVRRDLVYSIFKRAALERATRRCARTPRVLLPIRRRGATPDLPHVRPTTFDLSPLSLTSFHALYPARSICGRISPWPIDPSASLIRDACALCRQVSAVVREHARAWTHACSIRSSAFERAARAALMCEGKNCVFPNRQAVG